MEMISRVNSFQISQSMQTEEICIFAAYEEPIYSKIMANLLQHCSHYEVFKFGSLVEALTAIGKKKESINLIITNVNQSNIKGFEILEYIEKRLNLPVISMPPNENTNLVSLELSSAVQLYIVKSLSVNNFKALWQHAYEKETGKATSDPSVSLVQAGAVEARPEDAESFSEASRAHQNRNRKEADNRHDNSEGSARDDAPRESKRRLVWADWLHSKFLEAIDILGPDKAFPKKIVEVMNVPGLTRENVASHLQKYRRSRNGAQERMQWAASSYGINPPTLPTEPSFPPSLASQINYLENLSFRPFQPLFSITNSASSIDFSHSFLRPSSTTTSIFSNLRNKEWLTGSSNQGSVQYLHGGSTSLNSNQGSVQYPYDGSTSLNQNLLNFVTAPLTSPTGLAQVDLGHAPSNTILPSNTEFFCTGPGQVDLGRARFNNIPSNTENFSTAIGQVDLGQAPSNTILPSNTETPPTGLGQVDLGHAPFDTILPSNTEIFSTGIGQFDLWHAPSKTILPINTETSSTGLGHAPTNTVLLGNTEPGGSFNNGDQVPSSSSDGTYVGFRIARDGMLIRAGQQFMSINTEGIIDMADLSAEGGNSVVEAGQKILLSGNDMSIVETEKPLAEGGKFINSGGRIFSGNVESIIDHYANPPIEGGTSCEKVFPDNAESSKDKDNQLGFPGNGESSKEATNVAAAQGGSSSDNIPPRQQPPLPQILRDDAEMQPFLDTAAPGLGSPLVFDDLIDSIFDNGSD